MGEEATGDGFQDCRLPRGSGKHVSHAHGPFGFGDGWMVCHGSMRAGWSSESPPGVETPVVLSTDSRESYRPEPGRCNEAEGEDHQSAGLPRRPWGPKAL
ncbi:hypothetical protein GCM10010234_51060 [Streptomyces hawaiiensis]